MDNNLTLCACGCNNPLISNQSTNISGKWYLNKCLNKKPCGHEPEDTQHCDCDKGEAVTLGD